jgi:hypothetical protein
MDPTFWNGFWGNVGHLWWLIFPIMGVAGGAARRWQVMSRERHQRKLETLRLKSELRTAELQARSLGRPSRGASKQAVAQPASVSHDDVLERLYKEHDEITARWLDYELDVAKLIAFPAMSDGRRPLTAAFLRAKKTADALRPASADAKVSEQRVTEYLDAVGGVPGDVSPQILDDRGGLGIGVADGYRAHQQRGLAVFAENRPAGVRRGRLIQQRQQLLQLTDLGVADCAAVLARGDYHHALAVSVREAGQQLSGLCGLGAGRSGRVPRRGLRGAERAEEQKHDHQDQAQRDPRAAARGETVGERMPRAKFCHDIKPTSRRPPAHRERE